MFKKRMSLSLPNAPQKPVQDTRLFILTPAEEEELNKLIRGFNGAIEKKRAAAETLAAFQRPHVRDFGPFGTPVVEGRYGSGDSGCEGNSPMEGENASSEDEREIDQHKKKLTHNKVEKVYRQGIAHHIKQLGAILIRILNHWQAQGFQCNAEIKMMSGKNPVKWRTYYLASDMIKFFKGRGFSRTIPETLLTGQKRIRFFEGEGFNALKSALGDEIVPGKPKATNKKGVMSEACKFLNEQFKPSSSSVEPML